MILKLENITKEYDSLKALAGVSLELRKGEALGLVGPNGSGKTTLLRIMLGLIKPSSGRVLVDGRELPDSGWKDFKRKIGYMPEKVSFYDNLTARETLKLFARVKGGSINGSNEFVGRILPEELQKRKVGAFSKGMLQRLNLAQALLCDPEILFLDEPTSGLDPEATREFYDILEEVRDLRGLTVALSSHILAEIEDKTDRVAIIKNGRLKALGSLEELYTNLSLPLRLTITLEARDKALEELLQKHGAAEFGFSRGSYKAGVPRENKMELMAALMEEKDRFTDLTIREPSLEEVFFGIY